MIRMLIAGFMVLMAGNANAASNENLYRDCKSFSDRSFEAENNNDLACFAYFTAAIEYSTNICELMAEAAKTRPSSAFTRSYFGGASDAPSRRKAIIQFYVNYMKAHPEEWKYNPSDSVRKAIKNIAPCE